jgi:hypothetical protein
LAGKLQMMTMRNGQNYVQWLISIIPVSSQQLL